jgi:rubrerythrin
MEDKEILARALKLEKDGEAFYLDAAKKSSDPETEKLYRTFAEDEKLHVRFIEQQFKALERGDSFQPVPELDGVDPIDVDAPIFEVRVELMEKLPEEASEEDALLFALGAEVKSFELYVSGSKTAGSEQGRLMFRKLAAVERAHFDLLMMRYESRFSYPR